MSDVRENILTRLTEVAASIPNIRMAQRNRIDIDETRLPAVIVLDGDEENSETGDVSQRPANKPYVMEMSPEIQIFLQKANAGSELDVFRRELIKRVLTDTQLAALIKADRQGNGAIRYVGCQVGLAQLRDLHGYMKAQFTLKYTLRPNDL